MRVSRRTVTRSSTSRPSTMQNWTNWEALAESILVFETTDYPKQKNVSVGTRRSVQLRKVAVSHQGRYGTEIMINSIFGGGTCSWVMIVNGINKYVTEMTEETQQDDTDYTGDSTIKLVAKARPKQTMPTSSSPRVMYHTTCVYGSSSNQESTTRVVSKFQRWLRQDPSLLREEDGAVEFRILEHVFRSEFTSSQHWSLRARLHYLQKMEDVQKRGIVWIHTLFRPSCTFEEFKATQHITS